MIVLSDIPSSPGCYIFKDEEGKILYVGKAKDLKKRVSSYLNKNNLDPKTEAMVSRAESVDFISTDTENESFILENNLIKEHQPRYNIMLKDAKRYAYVLVTKEDFPRVMSVRDRKRDGHYYGPFVSGRERQYVVEMLRKSFRIRTCRRFPKKPCLRYHIDLCDAPCVGYISKEDYSANIQKVEEILKGKTSEVLATLKKDMDEASSDTNFEHAMRLRDRINALEYLQEKQSMERDKKYDEDILNYEIKDDIVYLVLFNLHKGTLINKKEFTFEQTPEFLDDFIKQYYSDNTVPKELIVPHEIDPSISEHLSEKRGSRVKITVPQKGEKKRLLSLVTRNIEQTFFRDLKKLDGLRKLIGLPEKPFVIECFDISHLSGSSTVASMVQFRNGKADRSNYRRYKIKTVDKIDDFASIAEVVRRRYERLALERSVMPDLVIIDGGKGQLNAAVHELKKLNLRIPIISIAKKEEEIFLPGTSDPIIASRKDIGLQFVQEIRDEAHRFAISYNRLLRKKTLYD